jgi:hypothetical protein
VLVAGAVEDQPLSHLRGAGVDVDARRVARVLVALVSLALGALAVTFLLVGLNKNNQINQLQRHGTTVDARVSGCVGELGGTGTNAAGYSCRGSFVFGGVTYRVTIPGNVLRDPGSEVRIVTLPSNPYLVETTGALANEHATLRVFVLPIVLFALFILVVGTLLVRRRTRRSA